MMAKVQTLLPRSMTRPQWRAVYRQVRALRAYYRRYEEKMIQNLRNPLFGTAPMRADMLEHLVNPPLVLGPYQ